MPVRPSPLASARGRGLTPLVDRSIRYYQRAWSPRKGFTCAHLVAHGGLSCSEAVRREVLARGAAGAFVPTAVRLFACYRAATLLAETEVRGVCCCGPIPIPFRF